jgi:anion-transporting  ArsA/GET3 family ATPase
MTDRGGRSPALDVDALLDDPAIRIVVCCGSGGVGKTTTSAALAVRAADRGRRVAVLTIDPARRLAQALGLTELGNEPGRVAGVPEPGGGSDAVSAEAPRGPDACSAEAPRGSDARSAEAPRGSDARSAEAPRGGELHAMMLDMRRTFDEMVQTHATAERAATILANPFYQTISSSFSGTQEYMAMEKLGQLAATGRWDLIVVDTPPSRSALDFLDAPQRMSTFLDGRMIRLLSSPARAGGRSLRKVLGAGFSLFAKAVSTILGGQLLADASAFVQAFDTMFGGFRERATATYALLRSPGTAFLVVATPEPDALREAAYFVDRLRTEDMPLAGLVLNRTHPVLAPLSATRARDAADELSAAPLAAAVLRLHADRVDRASREDRLLARFSRAHPAVAVARVPAVAGDVADLAGLREIGARLAANDHHAPSTVEVSGEPEPAGHP